MKAVSLSILFLLFTLLVTAQNHGEQGRSFDPEKMAERQSASMAEVLSLSDAQLEKIKAVNLKYAQLQMDLRANSDGDFSQMREQMMEFKNQRMKETKVYLTNEQFVKLQAFEEERRSRRGNRQGDDRKERNKKPNNPNY